MAATQKVARIATTLGEIVVKFLPDKAPNHVQNFIKLANQGFYTNVVFHRVIPGFMVQGGCPDGTGTGGPGYTIKAEFNDVPHKRGIVSMARKPDPNSAGSQFFFVHKDSSHLDRQYTAFGQIISGIEVVDKICAVPRDQDRPKTPVKMTKVTIEDMPI